MSTYDEEQPRISEPVKENKNDSTVVHGMDCKK